MIDHPIYLYGNMEVPSVEDGALFHYTKLNNFLDIIKSMTLRSSPLIKMNDLNEANIDSLNWNTDFMLMIKAQSYVKEQCSVISFTKNYLTGSFCEEGSNHPALWAHYADDSNGVCIVLDKDSLIENNKVLLADLFYRIEPLRYLLHCAPKANITQRHYSDVSDFVQRNYRELFFKKQLDWKHEDEIRFFVESPEVYLNIQGAIKHIILGVRLSHNEESLKSLVEQMITPGTKSYRYLITRSFAEMRPSINGYSTDSAAYLIDLLLRKLSKSQPLAKEHLDWERAV